MPEHAVNELPRIALVYGQEAAVAHVREAVGGQVDVVYAASADEFDFTRMHDTRAMAALVNLDGGDWLDAVEARLQEAGVAVIYNDPEISRGLEGWERARWLRHLVAKLRGSRDVDPPRPEPVASPAPSTIAAAIVVDDAGSAAAPADAGLAELPLSPEEIETMTVDLVAEHKPAIVAEAEGVTIVNDAPADVLAMDLAIEEAAASASKVEPAARPDTMDSEAEADFSPESGLDVDTEALSAMIDARLAEPEAPSDSPEVWRVVSGAAMPAGQSGVAAEPLRMDAASAGAPAKPVATAQDDVDVLASLPSLDDWQLVDPETTVANTGSREHKAPELSLPDSLAGLELVPMETIVPLKINADPIERWLHESEAPKPRTGTDGAAAKAKVGGGQA